MDHPIGCYKQSLCYISRGAPCGIDPTTIAPSANALIRIRRGTCSVVECLLVEEWVIGSIPSGGLVELYLITASAPRLV